MAVALTYDANECTDGSGAQVQRIFGIYAISKKFRIQYHHSKIVEVDFNPGDGIQTPLEMQRYIVKLNEFLGFLHSQNFSSLEIRKLDFHQFPRILRFKIFVEAYYQVFFGVTRLKAFLGQKNLLLKVSNPYPLIDQTPNSYSHLKELNPFRTEKSTNTQFSIHLHLVRSKVSQDQLATRFTSDEWYLTILGEVIEVLTSNEVEYEIIIHTDVSKSNIWELPSGSNSESRKYWENAGIAIDNDKMSVADESAIQNFLQFERVRILTGVDPVIAWSHMSSADLLLMGKSSFSYVGALLNKSGLIVGSPFWHSFPSNWYSVILESPNTTRSLIREVETRVRKMKNTAS